MKPVRPDEHLRAALRHAPDAQDQAPPEISAQILAAAHRQAEQTRRRLGQPLRGGWRPRWRAWGASGALATVVMAGFIGLMWRGEQPGPAVDEAPVAAQGVAADAPTAAPTAPGKPVQAAPAPTRAAPSAATPTPLVVATQKSSADRAAPQRLSAEPQAEAVAGAAAAAPSPPAAPPAAQATAPAMARTAALPEANQTSHPRLLTPPRAAPAPEAAWWAQLDTLTAGRWQPARGKPASGALLLTPQPGAPQGLRVWIEPDAVLRCPAQGTCERAPVDAATLQPLREALRH